MRSCCHMLCCTPVSDWLGTAGRETESMVQRVCHSQAGSVAQLLATSCVCPPAAAQCCDLPWTTLGQSTFGGCRHVCLTCSPYLYLWVHTEGVKNLCCRVVAHCCCGFSVTACVCVCVCADCVAPPLGQCSVPCHTFCEGTSASAACGHQGGRSRTAGHRAVTTVSPVSTNYTSSVKLIYF